MSENNGKFVGFLLTETIVK